MDTKLIAGGTLAGLVVTGGFAGLVSAQSVAEATALTEAEVIEIALAEVPGEVTETELERHRGQQVFEIEIVSEDGAEMEVLIVASTGEVLRVKEDGENCDSDHDDDDEDENDDGSEDADIDDDEGEDEDESEDA